MRSHRSPAVFLAAALAGCALLSRAPADGMPVPVDYTAPDSFDVEMVTTKGTLVVRTHRAWSPRGADRFYTMVRRGFFDSVAFHRTINRFVAQFGIHGDTTVTRAWENRAIPDDTVRAKNERGTLSFARGGPNTRNTQLFFNTVDNTPRLDTLNGFGFPPIGHVVRGLAVLDSLNWEYSGTRGARMLPGPSQDSIRRQGNAYLVRRFPRLDYIRSARVVRFVDPDVPLFTFETDEFWLNLHHFLYVLGRAQQGASDAAREAVAGAPGESDRAVQLMDEGARASWQAAVRFYAEGPSRRDLIFDDTAVAITTRLAALDDAPAIGTALPDLPLRETLERVAPLYREHVWERHRAANRARRAALDSLVTRHGEDVLRNITRWYEMRWRVAGYPVHLTAYANWAGAYSTTGDLLVVSSASSSLDGLNGLEIVFHEAMHQWDDAMLEQLISRARNVGVRIPRGLTHAMIFHTAGEAVRSVAPRHQPYAEAAGVWDRGLRQSRRAMVEGWQPWLEGRITRDSALTAVVRLGAITTP